MRRSPLLALAVLAPLAAPLPVLAQEGAPAPDAAPLLRLSAQGHAEAAPDAAEISFAAEVRAETTAAAMEGVAARMAKVIEAIKALGIPAEDIATTDVSLYPRTIRDKQDRERVEHVASSSIRVGTEKFDLLDDLIDAATTAGATHVQSPEFVVSDIDALEEAARTDAVKRLMAKARNMACAAGMKLDGLVELVEGGAFTPSPGPRMAMAAMAEGALMKSPPIEAGRRETEVSVSGVWRMAPDAGGSCASPQ